MGTILQEICLQDGVYLYAKQINYSYYLQNGCPAVQGRQAKLWECSEDDSQTRGELVTSAGTYNYY